jgi:hypothetical protein
MHRAFFFCFSCVVFILSLTVAPGCSQTAGTGGGGSGGAVGSVVVGVTSDLRVGVDLVQIHVVMRAAGSVVNDEVLSTTSTAHPLALLAEFPFTNLPDGTPVDVSIDAFGPGSSTTPLLNRLAATTVVAGEKLLLHVSLDANCVVGPGTAAPTCSSPQTCSGGVCVDEQVPASTLPAYTPGWNNVSTDPCKLAGGGAPIVIVGQGQADYLPMMDGDTAQVEQGPQGGHHIWVAIRAKNLAQSGSITDITGHFPDLNIDVGPFDVIFTMEQDEGGYCKLYGLRFQLDQNNPIQGLLGHPLDVTVKVTDPTKAVGVGTRNVVLSQTYIM